MPREPASALLWSGSARPPRGGVELAPGRRAPAAGRLMGPPDRVDVTVSGFLVLFICDRT